MRVIGEGEVCEGHWRRGGVGRSLEKGRCGEVIGEGEVCEGQSGWIRCEGWMGRERFVYVCTTGTCGV